MRKIKTLENGNQKAIIYRNTDWDEYVTQYFVDGVYLGEQCDSFADDRVEAIATAEAEMVRGMSKPAPSEAVQELGTEFLSDIASCAVSASAEAWANVGIFATENGQLRTFRVTDSEDASISKLITLETIAKGIKAILADENLCNDETLSAVRAAVAEKDAGHIDRWAADAIVQIGAFGEIVYG